MCEYVERYGHWDVGIMSHGVRKALLFEDDGTWLNGHNKSVYAAGEQSTATRNPGKTREREREPFVCFSTNKLHRNAPR